MKKLAVLFCLLFSCVAHAQQPIHQSGFATPGHALYFLTNGVAADAGTAAQGFLTSIGVTAQGPGICQNSAPITQSYNQICLVALGSGNAGITFTNHGTTAAFTISVNGVVYQFPFTSSGTIGPPSTSVGDLACWNNTVGTLLSDCGLAVTSIGGVQGSITLGNGLQISGSSLSVTAGIPTNISNTQTSNYALVNTDCGKTVQLGTGTTGFFSVTVPASVSGFPSTCLITILNGDTTRAKRVVNDPGCDAYHFIWMGLTCEVGIVNGAWAVLQKPFRFSLTGALTLYANSASGTDGGTTDCLGAGASACATVTHAANIICDEFVVGSNQVSIQLPVGISQVENVTLCNYTRGSSIPGTNNPQVLGSAASPGSYGVVPASGIAVENVNVNTPWTLNGFQALGTVIDVEADINSLIYIKNMILNQAPVALESIYGGKIEAIGPNTLTGPFSGAAVITSQGGQFLSQAFTMTCSSGFSVGVFAYATTGGLQEWSQAAFSGCGSVTGPRATAIFGGGIDTGGGGQSFFPGNSNGTVISPGWVN